MALKYKIGDRVRIKSIDWYNENKDKVGNILYKRDGSVYPVFFSKYMSNFCGEILTIKSVFKHSYHMNETSSCEFWTDEMIEGLVEEETKPKFKVGDKIKLKSTLLNDVFGVIGYESEGYRITNISNGLTYFMSYSIEHYYELVEEEVGLVDNLSSRWVNEFSLPEGYIFKDENGNVINAMKIVLEKKTGYPKTYEECCKVLGVSEFEYNHTGTKVWYRHKLMATLDKLMLCRDAYWKIAGEEMGLGKPWIPVYQDDKQDKHCIYVDIWGVTLHQDNIVQHVLSFPTKEMRDAFKENFDPDIEFCKELL